MGTSSSNFFEVLIYLFSNHTRKLLNSSIYQNYEEVQSELPFIKGRLDTEEYIRENIAKGRWHKINCTFDAFILDNEFNRIVKYVTTLLFNHTTSQDNKKNLREILFILDEVSDVSATPEQCSRISFNPMFGEFETVRDYCQLFLNNCISFDYKNELKLFAFLLPMDYVFEDFVFGFIDKELNEISARSQRSDTSLDVEGIFYLKPDLWLKTPEKSLIADTKYKIVYSDEVDPKKGISQNDLYQMLAYAVRFKVDEIILLYPNTIKGYQREETTVTIEDCLANGKRIKVRAFQIPIISQEVLRSDSVEIYHLQDTFYSLKLILRDRMLKILRPV